MEDNLNRVESAVSATSSGNLTWGLWPHDCAVALGFAGQRNPLGFALVRYLGSDPSSVNAWNVVLVLITQLQKQGVDVDLAKNAAWSAFEFWRDIRCKSCHGRGVVDASQRVCSSCGGSGQRRMPVGPDAVRAGISCLIEAEQWMEGQLAARLKRGG